MFIPTITYPGAVSMPDPATWEYGHGQPPPGRTPDDGPWLDVDTRTLYVPDPDATEGGTA